MRVFLSLPTGTVTLTWGLVLLLTKPLSAKAFFKTASHWTKNFKNKSFLFRSDFYYNIKIKKFFFTTSVSLLHSQSPAYLCGWNWENLIWESEKKKKLFAGLGSDCTVKNRDPGLENAVRGWRPRAGFFKTSAIVFHYTDLPSSK